MYVATKIIREKSCFIYFFWLSLSFHSRQRHEEGRLARPAQMDEMSFNQNEGQHHKEWKAALASAGSGSSGNMTGID